MSAPLKEVRIYVPEWVHILLTARSRAFGQDIGALAKEQVIAYAKRELHAQRLAEKAFRNTGMQPELFGDDTEEDGTSRSGGRK